jgi:hypothetical protein
MMEEELRQLVKDQGWKLVRRMRRGKEYFYARKWKHGDTYLAPVSKLESITEEHIKEKLAKAP